VIPCKGRFFSDDKVPSLREGEDLALEVNRESCLPATVTGTMLEISLQRKITMPAGSRWIQTAVREASRTASKDTLFL
jgi:hypothetical protein